MKNLDSGVGIYAPDADAYKVFADLFDPIIEDYHVGFKETDKHLPPFFGDPKDFGTLDPEVRSVLLIFDKKSNALLSTFSFNLQLEKC